MCSTSRSSGFTIAAAWKRTARSAASCALFFDGAARWSGCTSGLFLPTVRSAYFNSRLEIEDDRSAVLTGVVAASGLLHFYYDGFIWKVRDRSTREHLGLARRKRICGITRSSAQLAVARVKMGCGICDSTRRALDRANPEQAARSGATTLGWRPICPTALAPIEVRLCLCTKRIALDEAAEAVPDRPAPQSE